MCTRYLILCLSVAAAMAELPVFMGAQRQDETVPPFEVVVQQLPHAHGLTDFLPPAASYGVPAVSPNHDIKSVDFEMPSGDSYEAALRHSSSQHHQTGYDHGPTQAQVHKYIYVHVPPKEFEQEDDIRARVTHQTGPKQKHYRIVFIKAPEAPGVQAPVVPPLPQNEEKTLIYVLHKKPEAHPDIVIPTPEPTKPSKPEVYFIKYKTQRQEAPVYGPPPASNSILLRQTDENNNTADDDFMPLDLLQNELDSTIAPPQYDEGAEQQQAEAKLFTEAPSNFYSAPSESNSSNEHLHITTVDPTIQYLPPQTTLAPIIVKSGDDETDQLPASSFGAPKRNRFFIKKRK